MEWKSSKCLKKHFKNDKAWNTDEWEDARDICTLLWSCGGYTVYFIIPRSLYAFIFYYKISLCWLLNQLFSFLLTGRLSKLLLYIFRPEVLHALFCCCIIPLIAPSSGMNTCPWCTCWLHFLRFQTSGLREKAEILEDERVEKTAAPGGAGEKSKHPSAVYCGCHRWKLGSAEEKPANEEEAARFPRIKTLRANFTLPADGFYLFKFSPFL